MKQEENQKNQIQSPALHEISLKKNTSTKNIPFKVREIH